MAHSAAAEDARDLGAVERIYRRWGHHPRLYAAQDLVTFLGRHRTIRRRAVEAMHIDRGARVLEVACGTGRNFPYIEAAIGLYVPATGWDPERDVIGDIERVFGNVATETFNAGTFFVAWAEKREAAT